MSFKLPQLPYAYDALTPHIDAMTMQIHHTKHHQTYVDNLNKAMETSNIPHQPLENLLNNTQQYPVAIRNNAGGHYNHSLFWTLLSPQGGGKPTGQLANAIHQYFGSFDTYKEKFSNAAATRFGSGWAWLCINAQGALYICSTPNQDNPLMDIAEYPGTPILGLDVWEHAYYLHYQNRRPEYIAHFWHLVDWTAVEKRFQQALL